MNKQENYKGDKIIWDSGFNYELGTYISKGLIYVETGSVQGELNVPENEVFPQSKKNLEEMINKYIIRMRFEEGDRVVRTYKGRSYKGIVVVFDINCKLHYMVKSLETEVHSPSTPAENDKIIHWNIDENITRDKQYYREERLKNLLG